MSVTTSIEKPLETGYMQVNAKEKSGYTRYYKVPQKAAGKFAEELKKQDKNLTRNSNILFFTSIFAGALGAAYFTRKMDGRFKQFLIQTASAIALATATAFGFSTYAEGKQKELLNKYKAHEIFYKA